MASMYRLKDSVLLTGGEEELRNGVGIDRDTGTAAKELHMISMSFLQGAPLNLNWLPAISMRIRKNC